MKYQKFFDNIIELKTSVFLENHGIIPNTERIVLSDSNTISRFIWKDPKGIEYTLTVDISFCCDCISVDVKQGEVKFFSSKLDIKEETEILNSLYVLLNRAVTSYNNRY